MFQKKSRYDIACSACVCRCSPIKSTVTSVWMKKQKQGKFALII